MLPGLSPEFGNTLLNAPAMERKVAFGGYEYSQYLEPAKLFNAIATSVQDLDSGKAGLIAYHILEQAETNPDIDFLRKAANVGDKLTGAGLHDGAFAAYGISFTMENILLPMKAHYGMNVIRAAHRHIASQKQPAGELTTPSLEWLRLRKPLLMETYQYVSHFTHDLEVDPQSTELAILNQAHMNNALDSVPYLLSLGLPIES